MKEPLEPPNQHTGSVDCRPKSPLVWVPGREQLIAMQARSDFLLISKARSGGSWNLGNAMSRRSQITVPRSSSWKCFFCLICCQFDISNHFLTSRLNCCPTAPGDLPLQSTTTCKHLLRKSNSLIAVCPAPSPSQSRNPAATALVPRTFLRWSGQFSIDA